VYGSPVYGSEHAAPKRSSARPPADKVSPSLYSRIHRAAADDSPHVIVLDTGLAKPPFRPHALTGGAVHACTAADRDEPDELGDGVLDPAAGHGTFITGVIAQVAPGCEITHHRVLSTFGDGAEWDVIDCLIDMLPLPDPKRTILNLSFGGYVLDHPHALAWAIRKVREHGAQVVASAGNDAISRPTFPAALPGVVAVGAIGPSGPAPFSNYGAWVNAAAPGYELLSTFFQKFEEAEEAEEDEDDDGATGTDDPDEFQGWAIWSGTSFSAPVVVGNLARLMMADTAMNGHAAVRRLLDAPAVMRIPNLGVVVNFM
jgi:subtilisin family serine protease